MWWLLLSKPTLSAIGGSFVGGRACLPPGPLSALAEQDILWINYRVQILLPAALMLLLEPGDLWRIRALGWVEAGWKLGGARGPVMIPSAGHGRLGGTLRACATCSPAVTLLPARHYARRVHEWAVLLGVALLIHVGANLSQQARQGMVRQNSMAEPHVTKGLPAACRPWRL